MNFLSREMRVRHDPQYFKQNCYTNGKYHTDALNDSDMKSVYGEELFNKLHTLPDPLMKNLGDTLAMNMTEGEKVKSQENKIGGESTLSGITGFFSGMMSTLAGVMFRRSKPSDIYQGTLPQTWQDSKSDYKNILNITDKTPNTVTDLSDNKTDDSNIDKLFPIMITNKECKEATDQKLYAESSSVDESFEDAFSPEDFMRLTQSAFIEYYIPSQNHKEEFLEIETPKIKVEFSKMPEHNLVSQSHQTKENTGNVTEKDPNYDLVTSCEDKLKKIRALLQNRRRNKTHIDTEGIEDIKSRRKQELFPGMPDDSIENSTDTSLNVNINENLNFGEEVDVNSSTGSSPLLKALEKSELVIEPDESFDEVSGRFHKASTSSEDSFQIVFNDVPRTRRTSECDSEDSFIVFEDNPDDCYTTNDIFGDSDSDTDSSDSESDCCDLYLSKTVKNLTDDSLYDEVDYGRILSCSEVCPDKFEEYKKHAAKKDRPVKRVTFSDEPPKVHVMRVWAFAARQARAGHWERYALDRERFKRRIADVEMAVSWVLKPQHRSRVMFQRFMPWWNAEDRRQLAENSQEQDAATDRDSKSDKTRAIEGRLAKPDTGPETSGDCPPNEEDSGNIRTVHNDGDEANAQLDNGAHSGNSLEILSEKQNEHTAMDSEICESVINEVGKHYLGTTSESSAQKFEGV
ncbi:uncharacterized protein LOC101742884 [Bombyx mori]|uniref:Protein phosphatase 1 regulatory subunit 15A/B C-terminal domain-containing protein n=1 Tax=Bombyx mori TaxID=7091 RepID=A0A8R1WH60_BOMMO|nr:uncharacterized protein LOC101742884 [Bombyx mori]